MNQVKKKLVPKLRFKEFEKDGEWEEKKLGEVCEILNNRRRPISSNDREKGRYPYYGASGIVDYVKDYLFDERLVLVGEDGAKWGSNEKTAFIAEGKYWVNNHAHVLKPIKINDVLLTNFLVMTDLMPFITGAAPPKLTLGKLKTISIPLPRNSQEYKKESKLEEQKIADCLSSLDELIEAEDQKLEALQRHKKGLMQELFPAEGQTLPRLRFPEFASDVDWEEVTLERALSSISNGLSIEQTSDPSGFRVTRIETISDQTINLSKVGFINTEQDISDYKLEVGDILFSNINSIVHIGKTVIIDRDYDLYHGMNLLRFQINKDKNNPRFIFYLLNTEKIRSYFRARANKAVNQASINQTALGKVPIIKPELSEQQKIADCLSSLDELIEAQTKKLKSLRLHKKGLMQQLFPNISEAQ